MIMKPILKDHFSWQSLIVPVVLVLSLWIAFWTELRLGYPLKTWGIYPQKLKGLYGIVLSPWIHGNLNHLVNNSLPLGILTMALFYFYRGIKWRVLLLGLLLTGGATWLIGRPSWHIGASGLIYMLVSFLFFKGIWSKQSPLVALALTVVFLYGGLFWYLFPLDPKISWEGHSAGFVVGLFLALVYKKSESPLYERYPWQRDEYVPENDPFMRQFDEHGHFVPEPEDGHESLTTTRTDFSEETERINYVYKEKRNRS